MQTVILSAFRPEETLMNKYRHDLLVRYLQLEGYAVRLCSGVWEGVLERSAMLKIEGRITDGEYDMFIMLGTMFEQDCFLLIDNDVAFRYDIEGGMTELGIWWDLDDACCPPSVRSAVFEGAFTKDESNGTVYGIQTPEMAKADAYTVAEKAYELAVGERKGGVRSFIYGTPEWLERSASAARNYPY